MRDTAGMVALRVYERRKPVIAASNGAAVGAGAMMFLCPDFRLASVDARLGFVFTCRGHAPDDLASIESAISDRAAPH